MAFVDEFITQRGAMAYGSAYMPSKIVEAASTRQATKNTPVLTWGAALVCVASLLCAGVVHAKGHPICKEVQSALANRQVGKPDSFLVQSVPKEGRDLEYVDVDLDTDKKPDRLLQSCGSASEGTCTLYVTLSTGGQFEFTDAPFFVARFDSKYYVLVGESLSEPASMKRGKRQLYRLTADGAALVCKTF